jgi:hypothetical protein
MDTRNLKEDIAGICEEDGCVKCRDCMEAEDWKKLKPHNVIRLEEIEGGERPIYCDYCEKRLKGPDRD